MTDSTALEKYAATQDPEAFAHLVQRYGQMVYATCLRTLGHATDAEDAAQDTFVQLATSAGSIRSNAAAWLHRTATNVSINRMRSAGRRRAREAAVATPERVGDATPTLEWAEIRDAVDETLAAMPDESRALIVQRYLVGRTQVDLAAEHGVSASRMSRKVNGAVEDLRERLRGRGAVAGVSALMLGLAAEAAVPVSADLMARLVTPGLAGVPLAAAAAAGGTKAGLWSLPIKLSTAVLGSMAIHGLILGAYLLLTGGGTPAPDTAAPAAPRGAAPASNPTPAAANPIRVTSETDPALDAADQEASPGFVYLMGDTSIPGAYTLPDRGELTLLELLASAGVVDEFRGRDIELLRRDADGEREPTRTLRWDDADAGVTRGLVLQANDVVNLVPRATNATTRVTLFDVHDAMSGQPVALDFETGKLSSLPPGASAGSDPAVAFLKAEKIDLIMDLAAHEERAQLIANPGADDLESVRWQDVDAVPYEMHFETTDGNPVRVRVDKIDVVARSVTLQYQIGSVAKQPDPCIVDPALSGVWEFLAEDVDGQPAPSAINASMWKMRLRFAGDTLETTSSDGSVRLLWRLTRKALGSHEEAWVQTLIEVEGDHDMVVGSELLLFLTQWRVDGDRVNFPRSVLDPAADEWKPVPAGHFDANGHRVFLQRVATES